MAAARKRSVRSSRRSVDADEEQLSERPRVEREGDLDRHAAPSRRRGPSPEPATGTRASLAPGSALDPRRERQPARGVRVPGQAKRRQTGRGLGPGRRLDLRGGEQVGERVEVVADADPPLRAGLERRRAAAGERIEDDVARARVAGDERVREGGREAREVGAHRVERVAPQPLLVLPLGRDRDRRQLERQLERELARRTWHVSSARVPTWAVGASLTAGRSHGGPTGRGV